MLEDPEQLGSGDPSEQARHGGIHAAVGKLGASQLAAEHPQPDKSAERHERAEAGDFEAAEPKKNGVNVPSSPIMSRRCNDFA